jgi:hypothetical protein
MRSSPARTRAPCTNEVADNTGNQMKQTKESSSVEHMAVVTGGPEMRRGFLIW